MPEKMTPENWQLVALTATAGVLVALVWWILKRTAAVDDREAAARAVYTTELRTIPTVLATQAAKLQEMKEDLTALQHDVAELERRMEVLADRVRRGGTP